MDKNNRYELDNIGKFYSAQAHSKNQTVFRLAFEMSQPVDADVLQLALDDVIAALPSFNVTLGSGAFWHYLQQSDIRPRVQPDEALMMRRIRNNRKSSLFRVCWRKNWIIVEMSHMLSDGMGAFEFLKTLVGFYIHRIYGANVPETLMHGDVFEQREDSFSENYEAPEGNEVTEKTQKAFRIPGLRKISKQSFCEYHASAEKVHSISHEMGVTVTSLVLALLAKCIVADMKPSSKRVIRICVPVDLRRLYSSETLGNFFGLAFINCTRSQAAGPLDELAKSIQAQMKTVTAIDSIKVRMNHMVKLERSPLLKYFPTFIKDWALSIADWFTSRDTTVSASSLGRIELPANVAEHVNGISVLTSTRDMSFTVCTFENDLFIGVSSAIVGDRLQSRFIKAFDSLGVPIRIQKAEALK